MRHSIVILEDDSNRIAVMDDCLADKFPFFERKFFRTAPDAIAWLDAHLSETACVSLDHDLEPQSPSDPDPGIGRDVADFLAARRPTCPVIIHTTNRPAAEGMELVLVDTGWKVERIMPYESCRWIPEAWLPLIRHAVVKSATATVSEQVHS